MAPISGWVGDNLLKKSTNMAWWSGCDIEVEAKSGTEKLHIDCLYDCLNNMARPPVRPGDAAMRLPVSGIYKIKGVGDVVAGRNRCAVARRISRSTMGDHRLVSLLGVPKLKHSGQAT